MCIWFPNWPIQRRRVARPWPEKQPLILFAPVHGKLRVSACCRHARAEGVKPGMTLAEAQAILHPVPPVSGGDLQALGPSRNDFDCSANPRPTTPALTGAGNFNRPSAPASGVRGVSPLCEPHDPRADLEALRQLAVWGQQFSPYVAIEESESPESLLLDVTGCGYAYGGEEGLAASVIESLRRIGYWAVAAVADTLGAAWAAAHFASSNHSYCIIPPGEHAEALQPLPVEALRLPMDAVQLLRDFNIRRIEQLMALPRADLPSRFGFEMLLRLDQALGVVPELLKPERTPEPIEESWPFEPPIANRRHVETAIGHLLEKLLERLRPRQIGVRRLLCSLQLVSREPIHFSVELLQPSHSHRHLMELASLRLERLTIAAEVSGIRLQATFAAPLEFHQEQLFAEGERANWWRSFSALLERLSGRLGERYVLRPQLLPDPQPEFACRHEPWLKSSIQHSAFSARRPAPRTRHLALNTEYSVPSTQYLDLRPPCLTSRPVALAVVSVVPGGPPIQFHWKDNRYIVAHSWGPERIETGWWRGADIRRDYYLVESTQGERFWLFRSLPDEVWFLHGVFM